MLQKPLSAETPAELRAVAEHPRRLARGLRPNDETARRLAEIADELEARADAPELQQKPP